MTDEQILAKFERVVRDNRRYARDAFGFLEEGLALAAQRVYGEAGPGRGRHVTGQQLCLALRELAITRWGPLARLVLRDWGIQSTRDFGEMVFLLVHEGLLGKQESDRIEDFDDVYEFDEAFGSYEVRLGSFDS